MDTALFDQRLLKVRRKRAQQTFAKARYLARDIECTLLSRMPPLKGKESILILGCPGQEMAERFSNHADVRFLPLWVFDEAGFTLPHNHYDIIIEGWLFHWLNDPLNYLLTIRQALKAGGLYLSGFLGGKTLTELRQAFIETDMQLLQGACARVSPMIPAEAATRLLHTAGFQDPVVDHEEIGVAYPRVKDLIHDLRLMGETNALKSCRQNITTKAHLDSLEATYHALFGGQDKALEATFDFVFMSGLQAS
jgi:hypothetical protein